MKLRLALTLLAALPAFAQFIDMRPRVDRGERRERPSVPEPSQEPDITHGNANGIHFVIAKFDCSTVAKMLGLLSDPQPAPCLQLLAYATSGQAMQANMFVATVTYVQDSASRTVSGHGLVRANNGTLIQMPAGSMDIRITQVEITAVRTLATAKVPEPSIYLPFVP